MNSLDWSTPCSRGGFKLSNDIWIMILYNHPDHRGSLYVSVALSTHTQPPVNDREVHFHPEMTLFWAQSVWIILQTCKKYEIKQGMHFYFWTEFAWINGMSYFYDACLVFQIIVSQSILIINNYVFDTMSSGLKNTLTMVEKAFILLCWPFVRLFHTFLSQGVLLRCAILETW